MNNGPHLLFRLSSCFDSFFSLFKVHALKRVFIKEICRKPPIKWKPITSGKQSKENVHYSSAFYFASHKKKNKKITAVAVAINCLQCIIISGDKIGGRCGHIKYNIKKYVNILCVNIMSVYAQAIAKRLRKTQKINRVFLKMFFNKYKTLFVQTLHSFHQHFFFLFSTEIKTSVRDGISI